MIQKSSETKISISTRLMATNLDKMMAYVTGTGFFDHVIIHSLMKNENFIPPIPQVYGHQTWQGIGL